MGGAVREGLALVVFFVTVLLIFMRPKGLNEAWATAGGALAMVALGIISPLAAWRAVAAAGDVLLFLLGLLALAALLERTGFFNWAALVAGTGAKGDRRALFRNVFLLGAAVTALLSLDTTAIILTPIVLGFVRRLDLRDEPFVLVCAFVATTGSLLLPISNLTNLLFRSAFHFGFLRYVAVMALPEAIALFINYHVFVWLFRADITGAFNTAELPRPDTAIPDRVAFRASVLVLCLSLVAYFVSSFAGIPPFVVAIAGAAVLGVVVAARKMLNAQICAHTPWSVFPFVIGLVVLVRGVKGLPWMPAAEHLVHQTASSVPASLVATSVGTGLGSNILNNIPMALVAISVLKAAHAGAPAVFGSLLGCDLGPNLSITGSLATMLVIASARMRGSRVDAWQFFRIGVIMMPMLIVGAGLALWLSLALLGIR